jgi:hypothetical protein
VTRPLLWLACLLLASDFAASASRAEVYRCVDEKGQVGFRDKPCDEADRQEEVALPEGSRDRGWRVRGSVERGESTTLHPHGMALSRGRPHQLILHLTAEPIDEGRLAALRAAQWDRVGPMISVYLDRAPGMRDDPGPCTLSAVSLHVHPGDGGQVDFIGGENLLEAVSACELVTSGSRRGVRFAVTHRGAFRVDVGGTFPFPLD